MQIAELIGTITVAKQKYRSASHISNPCGSVGINGQVAGVVAQVNHQWIKYTDSIQREQIH